MGSILVWLQNDLAPKVWKMYISLTLQSASRNLLQGENKYWFVNKDIDHSPFSIIVKYFLKALPGLLETTEKVVYKRNLQ